MFLSLYQISQSLKALETVHPFYGTTFLVCKLDKLPVGEAVEYPINAKERDFLDRYYKPDTGSKYYYRAFRISDKNKTWVSPKYASSTLQSIRTRDFRDAFIHPKNTKVWGWQNDYLEKLKEKLYQGRPIPVFDLAVWLYRERNWATGTTSKDIIEIFFKEFFISEAEKDSLFEESLHSDFDSGRSFQDHNLTWSELQSITGKPADSLPSEGGALAYLGLQGIGPAKDLTFEPAERLNLITGDNGLGKTFILECAWWALTNNWAGLEAYPRQNAKPSEPEIVFRISGQTDNKHVRYDWQTQSWPVQKTRPTIPGLLIYARVDGSFAVWDPAKHYWATRRDASNQSSNSFVFTKDQIWDGYEEKSDGKAQVYLNGLLRDWITWQSKPDRYPFDIFKKVLRRLSPRDIGPLEPGNPVRLPFDAREIPTLKHAYGEVPIVHAAAGIRRIVAMAYLIVWAWHEHKTQSELIHKTPEKRMVVLIDEIEAHLHPRWQRLVLPALLDVREDLAPDLVAQFLIATHSPLIMASVEPRFDSEIDKLFHLNLDQSEIKLLELPFIRQGSANSWLTSEVFDLPSTRSPQAEEAIEQAKALQLIDKPSSKEVDRVSISLAGLLSADDEFWPRWRHFAEQHGRKRDSDN
jgi:hypothetical protein